MTQPASLKDFIKFHTLNGSSEYKRGDLFNEYDKYKEEMAKEDDCKTKTRHSNRKWNGMAGCFVCSDCGAWYV